MLRAQVETTTADDRFKINFGQHDLLRLEDMEGNTVVSIVLPTVSQTVHVGQVEFQVSYGVNLRGKRMVIFSPSINQPQDIHFLVLDKQVDADSRAVVTMTFSEGNEHVDIDPSALGQVQVSVWTPPQPSDVTLP